MNGKRVATIFGLMTALGCAGGGQDANGEAASSSSLSLVEHSAEEVSALSESHVLHLDLTTSEVHLIDFARVSDLLNVELQTEQGTFVLGELAEDLAQDSHRLVLGATQAALDAYFAAHETGATQLGSEAPLGLLGQARIKLRDCDGCVDPTGIGPVICDDDSPCSGTP